MLVHSFMTVLPAAQPSRQSQETAASFVLMAACPAHPSRIMQSVVAAQVPPNNESCFAARKDTP